jgi:hypothetical protein
LADKSWFIVRKKQYDGLPLHTACVTKSFSAKALLSPKIYNGLRYSFFKKKEGEKAIFITQRALSNQQLQTEFEPK